MELSERDKREYVKRLLLSRMRILCNNGFYGLLLMHAKFGLDEQCATAYTDGEGIYFSPKFLKELNDCELDFVMMHEIMHIALQHCFRGQDLDGDKFNIACDIVVNSNILYSNDMNLKSISVDGQPSMHKTPKRDEGYLYTAEEVYLMLPKGSPKNAGFDDHSHWKMGDAALCELWGKYLRDAVKTIEIRNATKNYDDVPLGATRILKGLDAAQTDWRTVLDNFVQEEINDYSFSPPDRRYEGDFFLPDFNESEAVVKNVVFLIDASGSVSDDMLKCAYSEINGAIEQFNGKIAGYLAFFDVEVYGFQAFCGETNIASIVAQGGGGTSFKAAIEYVVDKMRDEPPECIVLITDGYGIFPERSATEGIPVLWLLTNDEVEVPWGKVARIKI